MWSFGLGGRARKPNFDETARKNIEGVSPLELLCILLLELLEFTENGIHCCVAGSVELKTAGKSSTSNMALTFGDQA